jgi:hypothetical protein
MRLAASTEGTEITGQDQHGDTGTHGEEWATGAELKDARSLAGQRPASRFGWWIAIAYGG